LQKFGAREFRLASRVIRFSFGGLLILLALMLIEIAILADPAVNIGILINIGGPGLLFGFLGFYLIADALFTTP